MTVRGWTLLGWWLFVTSAAFFIASAVAAGDPLALAGACFFMAANVAFLIPFYAGERVARRGKPEE